MRYDLAVFDLDGTLLDTLDDLMNSVNHVLAANSFPLRTRDEIRRFVGTGIRNLIIRSLPAGSSTETIEEVLSQFRAHYAVHKTDLTAPYPGIPEALKDLQARGIRLAVVSNKADEAVQPLISRYFPDTAFSAVIGEKAGIRRKPAPDTVNAVLAALEIPREKTVCIGDSETDVQTAENAGCDLITVEWGFRTKAELQQAGAKVFAEKPSQLLHLIAGGQQKIFSAPLQET